MSKKPEKTDALGTSNGVEITEELLDEWADAYERGEWSDGKTLILGRPRLADEEVRPVTFKLPLSKIAALDLKASQRGGTRSEALREAVDEYLAQG